jgi:beta-glucuronidase
MLYPVNNKKRFTQSLNGLWDFAFVSDDYLPTHPLKNPRLMGVPGSFNDVVTEIKEREYVGKVCYERLISLQDIKASDRFTIRVGAATHHADVYLDGKFIRDHEGGYLPFDIEIDHPKEVMRLSIILDTRLGFQSFPMGEVKHIEHGDKQLIYFDFFNYIGLHRNVFLSRTSNHYIQDIIIKTKHNHETANISYEIKTNDMIEKIEVIDPKGKLVATTYDESGEIHLDHPILWDIYQGNMYQLCVSTTHDYYEQSFGIREIEVKDKQIYLNHRPIFLKGFGMHEDYEILGKGSHAMVHLRDFELLKWIGANSFRTSHYPYDEEIYDLADRYGILIIDEMPAVGLNFWDPRLVFTPERVNDKSLDVYKAQLRELVERDKNHPSVIMYSLANEANTHEEHALDFFEGAFAHARQLTDLPLMIVEYVSAEVNRVAHLADVIGINRYHGWYTDFGDLSVIDAQIKNSINSYVEKYQKPVVLTEFGADTIAGLHTLPAQAFSEEFQNEFIETYLNAIENLDGCVGTHLWNFADFQTKQGLTRVNGNKKGVFTRNRQPKWIAHTLRKRWTESK